MAAPGGTGVIGPFPPSVADTDEARDDYDRLRRRVLWSLPYGLYVIGSRHNVKRNLMTLNWCTQVSFDPKLVAIGVDQTALTHELIAGSRAFTINTVKRDDRAIVRKFTKPVDVDVEARTLNGFAYHDGPVTGVPVLDQAPSFVECEVRQEVACGHHTLFIGEVVNSGFQADEATEVLRMEDTRLSYGG
jgi:flavin reductase (DIM6/NTAB) family NADH-FMN oxidoreductase RutF